MAYLVVAAGAAAVAGARLKSCMRTSSVTV